MKYATYLLLAAVPLCFGCEPARDEKAVFPIQGTVHVDGKPAEGIQIIFHDVKGTDTQKPTFPQGVTDAQGKIRISTYADGDGAPEGEYKVTFAWQDFNVMSRSYSGPDKLNKKYSDSAQSATTLTVGKGQPNDLGTVELTTKK